MASGMLPFRPVAVVRPSTGTDYRKPEARKTPPPSHWWAPLFGVSSEPDYLQSDHKKLNRDPDLDPVPVKSPRFTPGTFTDEKAKQLRRMTTGLESFPDAMYHSAVASRLASDFTNGPAPWA